MSNDEENLLNYIKLNREVAIRELFNYLKDKNYYSVKFNDEIMETIFFRKISFDCSNGLRKRLQEDICELINGEASEYYLDLIRRFNYENISEYGLELTNDFVKIMKVWNSDKIDKKWNLNHFYYSRFPIGNIDISNMDFNGVKFGGCFQGKLTNTNFQGSEGLTIDLGFCDEDISNTNFEGTKFISFDYMDGSIIRGEVRNKRMSEARFRGVKGDFVIYPATAINKDCSYVDFGSAYIGNNGDLNELDGIIIHHANLVNCKTHFYKEMKISARLNPQTIKDKNLSYVKFGKILFTDNFDNCYISYSDFSNSIGAVINPQKVIDKDLRGVNFKDTTIIGSFDGCNLCDASFAGVKSDITIDINKVIYNENTNFTGVNVEGYNPEINAYNKTINKEEKQRKKILSLFDKARYK